MMGKNRMYEENRKSINALVGCKFHCVYCVPSFQRQMKRQRCPRCKLYEPHPHLDRLLKPPPKTFGKDFILFPSSADPCFAKLNKFKQMMDYAEQYPDRTFLTQSKNPEYFYRYEYEYGKFPENVILGTTFETDRLAFDTPSKYHFYTEISKAPPSRRTIALYA